MKRLMAPGATAVVVFCAGAALAQQIESSHTDLDFSQCTLVQSDDFGSTWACPGRQGMPVMVSERNRRMFVSYGLDSTREKAAEQTLVPPNRVGPTIEWRVSNAGGSWKPFATILGFFTEGEPGETEAQVLVVTRIEPGATCHVAYVDGRANANADELARDAADRLAPGFDCKDEPQVIGRVAGFQR